MSPRSATTLVALRSKKKEGLPGRGSAVRTVMLSNWFDGDLSPEGFMATGDGSRARGARAHACGAHASAYAQAHSYMRVHVRHCIRARCLCMRVHQRSSCGDFATRSRRPNLHRQTSQHRLPSRQNASEPNGETARRPRGMPASDSQMTAACLPYLTPERKHARCRHGMI